MFTRSIAFLCTLLIGFPALADDDSSPPTREELLMHPEVMGALATIDAWADGVYVYERVPGISVGIVRDQDRGRGCVVDLQGVPLVRCR